MKRGELSIGIIILLSMSILLAGIMLFFGFRGITLLTHSFEDYSDLNFQQSLSNAIKSESRKSFGSAAVISLIAPLKAEKICFVDLTKSINPLINTQLNFDIATYQAKNIFFLPSGSAEPSFIPNVEIMTNPYCITIGLDHRLNLFLESSGNSTLLKSKSQDDETRDCTSFLYSDSSDVAIDILFLPYKYTSRNEFQEDISLFTNSVLFKIEPFASHITNFNIFFKEEPDGLICDTSGYVRCDQITANRIASTCPHDYIIILVQRNALVNLVNPLRSSATMNMASINTQDNPNVFIHEFGHIFAHLADEYVDPSYSQLTFNVSNYPNCDTSGCNKWSSIPSTECIPGCSLQLAYRSFDSSIMRDLSSNSFGIVNELQLKKEIEASGEKK